MLVNHCSPAPVPNFALSRLQVRLSAAWSVSVAFQQQRQGTQTYNIAERLFLHRLRALVSVSLCSRLVRLLLHPESAAVGTTDGNERGRRGVVAHLKDFAFSLPARRVPTPKHWRQRRLLGCGD
jgi:hypothetical protein